jgi:hypothetical protein
MANQAFLELCSKIYSQTATREEVGEFKEAMKIIASKGASPQAIWDLNQIIVKQAQEVLKPKLDFLNYISETQHVGHGQKIEFRKPKGKIKMKWSARGTTVDYTRVGYQEKFSSEPVKIQGGAYYEYDQLLSGSTDGFTNVVDLLAQDMEDKIVAKAITVLHTAMASAPTPNRWSGAGITLANFNSVSSVVQRYNRQATTVCDIDFAKKLAGLVTDARLSDGMKDTLNENGLFGKVNGVDIVVFNNPFQDETNAKTVAPREYGYVLPAGTDKPVKIGFEGDLYQLTDTDIDSERVFLKVGQKVSVDVFDTHYIGELDDTSLV